jgi:arylsulfatase A-like enzyme
MRRAGELIRHAVWLLLAVLASGCASDQRPRALLVITVDTLRADRLKMYGSSLELMPNVDELAALSDVFRRAYAPAPFTLASISALLTGRYPGELGIVNNLSVVPAGTETLAGALQGRGWRTGAVISSFVLREACGLNVGFDEYDATYPAVEARRPVPERTAADTTDAALRMLDRLTSDRTSRVFLWVHFQDPHGPYTPPPSLRERYLDAERRAPDGRRRLGMSGDDSGIGGIPGYQFAEGEFEVAYYRAGYNGEAQHVDEHIGRLLRGLADRGLAAKTITVFAADHGEGLGEGDYWFAHGEYLTEALVRVPLIIGVPGRRPRAHDRIASLLDVLPTLAPRLGIALAPGLPGRDLLADDGSQPSTVHLSTLGESKVRRVGLVKESYKYVTTLGPGARSRQLFQLGSDDDDVLREVPEVAQAMQAELAAFEARFASGATPRAQSLTPADRARLEALGYVGE